MIVTCERCHARYKLDDAKIKGRGAKITCPKCSHVFVVYTQGAKPAPPPAAEPKPTPAPSDAGAAQRGVLAAETRKKADSLDFRKVGIASWKVKVKIGLVYDFSDIRTLRKYIQDKRVTEEDVISHDGNNWTKLGDIPDLDKFFLQVYREYEERQREGAEGGEEEFEDGPTMIVGMGSLGANLSTGVFQRPESDPAPPGSGTLELAAGPKTSGGQGGPRQFVDPFDALKSRQKQRQQIRRPQASPAGRAARSSGKKSSPSGSRASVLAIIGGLIVIAVLAYVFLSRNKEPVSVPEVSAEVPSSGVTRGVGTEEREAMREKMLAKLQAELEVTDPSDIIEPLSDDLDPFETLKPVIPTDAKPIALTSGSSSNGFSGVSQTRSTVRDYLEAGDAAAMGSDWDAAAAAYAKVVAMSGGNTAYKYKYGQALYNAGRISEAQVALTEAANGGVTNAHKTLGNILRDQGDVSGAVGHYNQYLKADPPDRTAIEAEIKHLTGG